MLGLYSPETAVVLSNARKNRVSLGSRGKATTGNWIGAISMAEDETFEIRAKILTRKEGAAIVRAALDMTKFPGETRRESDGITTIIDHSALAIQIHNLIKVNPQFLNAIRYFDVTVEQLSALFLEYVDLERPKAIRKKVIRISSADTENIVYFGLHQYEETDEEEEEEDETDHDPNTGETVKIESEPEDYEEEEEEPTSDEDGEMLEAVIAVAEQTPV